MMSAACPSKCCEALAPGGLSEALCAGVRYPDVITSLTGRPWRAFSSARIVSSVVQSLTSRVSLHSWG